MQTDPANFIGEVLGEPASQMRNPVNAGYLCPFVNSECTKRSHRVSGPFPVCSVYRWAGRGQNRRQTGLVCVCPNRLFQANLTHDILQHCWPGPAPKNPSIAYEVKMADFGKVDCVVADVGENQKINQFVSVELQTVDITGSYFPAYSALLNSQALEKPPTYNFNWRNVYKRYIMQLIFKGFFHHHWSTRIVAVMQDVLVDRLWETGGFAESPVESSNIVFLSYRMVPDPDDETRHVLEFVRPIGTRHMDLMNSILYHEAPSRESFVQKIIERL